MLRPRCEAPLPLEDPERGVVQVREGLVEAWDEVRWSLRDPERCAGFDVDREVELLRERGGPLLGWRPRKEVKFPPASLRGGLRRRFGLRSPFKAQVGSSASSS